MKKHLSIIALLIANLFYSQQVVDICTYNSSSNAYKYFKDINNYYNNFVGTWESTTGNTTFRITLVKVVVSCAAGEDFHCTMDRLNGSYKIIQDAGTPNETILFDSVKQTRNGRFWEYVIDMRSCNGVSAFGWIDDNNAIVDGRTMVYLGNTIFKIIPSSNGIIQAEWKVKRDGLRIQGAMFRVPTETIMTKVN